MKLRSRRSGQRAELRIQLYEKSNSSERKRTAPQIIDFNRLRPKNKSPDHVISIGYAQATQPSNLPPCLRNIGCSAMKPPWIRCWNPSPLCQINAVQARVGTPPMGISGRPAPSRPPTARTHRSLLKTDAWSSSPGHSLLRGRRKPSYAGSGPRTS